MAYFSKMCYLCGQKKEQMRMKVKLSKAQIQEILNDPDAVQKAGIKLNDPWWVIVLKVIAYAIGLILAGAVTTGCASLVAGIIMPGFQGFGSLFGVV